MARRKESLITDSFLLLFPRPHSSFHFVYSYANIFLEFVRPLAWFSYWKIANFADSVIYVSVWDTDFFCGSIFICFVDGCGRIGAKMDEKKQFGRKFHLAGWKLLVLFGPNCVQKGEKDDFSGLILHLPLLVPSGPLKIVHSSIEPNAPNSCLTSSSFCCLLNMPTKSFRSYYLS